MYTFVFLTGFFSFPSFLSDRDLSLTLLQCHITVNIPALTKMPQKVPCLQMFLNPFLAVGIKSTRIAFSHVSDTQVGKWDCCSHCWTKIVLYNISQPAPQGSNLFCFQSVIYPLPPPPPPAWSDEFLIFAFIKELLNIGGGSTEQEQEQWAPKHGHQALAVILFEIQKITWKVLLHWFEKEQKEQKIKLC